MISWMIPRPRMAFLHNISYTHTTTASFCDNILIVDQCNAGLAPDGEDSVRGLLNMFNQKAYHALWYQKNKDRLREKRRDNLKRWRLANPNKVTLQKSRYWNRHKEQITAKVNRWRQMNSERVKETHRAWLKANIEKCRKYARRNYYKNPEGAKSRARRWQNQQIRELGDYYIRLILKRRTNVHQSEWPADLVELKRAEIQLKRLCRKLKQTPN